MVDWFNFTRTWKACTGVCEFSMTGSRKKNFKFNKENSLEKNPNNINATLITHVPERKISQIPTVKATWNNIKTAIFLYCSVTLIWKIYIPFPMCQKLSYDYFSIYFFFKLSLILKSYPDLNNLTNFYLFTPYTNKKFQF